VLSGEVTRFTLDRHEEPGRTANELALAIRWQVYDRYKEDLVYSKSFSAQGESDLAVVEEIVSALVSDPRFASSLVSRTRREPVPAGVRTQWLALADSTHATGGSQIIIISRADLNPSRAGSVFEGFAGSVISITTPTGSGSGFIISKDGLALTNYHVVEEEHGIIAHLWNGHRVVVTVLRSDPDLDAALIRFECDSSCITAPLGSSSEVYVGDDVYTIGSPGSLSHTLTKGVVSGFREGDGGSSYIQTDAAVSPGSSGGPLIDAVGKKVIGIVTLKLVGPGDEGLGFAVAIEDVLRVLGIEYFGALETGT
jgi:S1-C subfamily serine protease